MDIQILAIIILTLGLTVSALALKNSTLGWISVPVWLIFGAVLSINTTWLGDVQWIFILLGFAGAGGMVFEVIRFKDRKEDDEGEEVDESQATWDRYYKQLDGLHKGRRSKVSSEDED